MGTDIYRPNLVKSTVSAMKGTPSIETKAVWPQRGDRKNVGSRSNCSAQALTWNGPS